MQVNVMPDAIVYSDIVHTWLVMIELPWMNIKSIKAFRSEDPANAQPKYLEWYKTEISAARPWETGASKRKA